jgi:hypothetical protein
MRIASRLVPVTLIEKTKRGKRSIGAVCRCQTEIERFSFSRALPCGRQPRTSFLVRSLPSQVLFPFSQREIEVHDGAGAKTQE